MVRDYLYCQQKALGGPMSILEIEDLRLTLEGALILDGVDAEIAEGALTAIVGPNGVVKSSLITHRLSS